MDNKLKQMIQDAEPFRFISDSGHGWVEVRFDLLRAMKIARKISNYSYGYQGRGFLEEDCDAQVFMARAKQIIGREPKVSPQYLNGDWAGRNFDSLPFVYSKWLGVTVLNKVIAPHFKCEDTVEVGA